MANLCGFGIKYEVSIQLYPKRNSCCTENKNQPAGGFIEQLPFGKAPSGQVPGTHRLPPTAAVVYSDWQLCFHQVQWEIPGKLSEVVKISHKRDKNSKKTSKKSRLRYNKHWLRKAQCALVLVRDIGAAALTRCGAHSVTMGCPYTVILRVFREV